MEQKTPKDFPLTNSSKLFFLSAFSSGASNFVRHRLETLPILYTQVLDAHNHPFFNKRVVNINFTDRRVHLYKTRFLKKG
jgi:hypothetical protein